MEHYIPQIKNNSFAQKYFALEKQPDAAQEKWLHITLYQKH